MFQEFYNYYDFWCRELERDDISAEQRAELQYCVKNIEKVLEAM